ncbi:MAG: hypothetical protein KAX28_07515 [Candidatus Marinimicrobia bacterium]|nr:hypothetical protein [Candidatus Neomarinimicrobiota bacterium]
MYNDENHSFMVISSDSEKRPIHRHKGIYEKLLCESCERIIGKYEDYSAKVLFDNKEKRVSIKKPFGFIFYDVDYTKFKLFQISLLWRASISNRSEIGKIYLGPHSEKMRKMLLNMNPGEIHEYGCSMFFIPNYSKEMARFIYPPELIHLKIKGYTWYRAIFCGLVWNYIVSSHSNLWDKKNIFLSKEGELPVINAGHKGMKFIQKLAFNLTNGRKLF